MVIKLKRIRQQTVTCMEQHTSETLQKPIIELVNSISRDGPDTLIKISEQVTLWNFCSKLPIYQDQ